MDEAKSEAPAGAVKADEAKAIKVIAARSGRPLMPLGVRCAKLVMSISCGLVVRVTNFIGIRTVFWWFTSMDRVATAKQSLNPSPGGVMFAR